MKVAHTPGPWRAGRDHDWSHPRIEILLDVPRGGSTPTTYHIADVFYPTSAKNTVGALEREANARLIAAAPELLAALEKVLSTFVTVHSYPEFSDKNADRFIDLATVETVARIAIAKAKGNQNETSC